MIGVVGRLNIEYKINGKEYQEVFEIGEDESHILVGCKECTLYIEEVAYVIDTIYGVSLYFNDNDEDSIYVSGNSTEEFTIKDYGITGKIKIVMF